MPCGTYTLTIAGTNEDANIDGDLDITTTLTISGAGAGSTIIDGNADERVFQVSEFAIAITITNVGITNGSDNSGGGIANWKGNSTLTLNNSAVFSNSGTRGGGIFNQNGATLTLNNSAVFSNSAAGGIGGGGIYNVESPLTLNNSAVSGNSATGNGGGIYNDAFISPATLNLNHSAITNNTADSDTAGGGDGGGIYNDQFFGTATVNFTNSIVAGNSDNSTPANNDCATSGGTQNSLGYNIIGNNDGCSVTAGTGDNFGTTAGPVDAKLLPLANNGGGTQTHALANGSPALEGAVCLAGFTTDQRGQPRPNPAGTFCDIGAYESTLAAVRDLAFSKTVTPTIANPGDTITYTLTFSNAGTGIAAGVIITDSIPVSVTHSSLSYTYTGAAIITPTGSISYVWNVEDLSVGEGGIITISGVLSDPLAGGTFNNTAEITTTSVDSDTNNNTASAGITVLGTAGFDLAVNKTAVSAVVPFSPYTATITYTVSVNNIDATPATGVVISDTLPVSVTFVSSSATNGSAYNPVTGAWNVGSVGAGTGVTMTLVVTANLVLGQVITNTAELNASTPADTNTGNNSSSVGVTRYIYYFPLIFKNGTP